MATPNAAPTAAAPTAPQAPVDPKAPGAAAPKLAPAAEVQPDAGKANGLESELATKFGADWEKLPAAMKQQVLTAEQKSRDADKKYQLAAKIQKDYDLSNAQMGKLVQALKEDPMSVLRNPALGHDVHALAEKIVWEKIQQEKMSPEQRRLAELEAENNRFKQDVESRKRQEDEARQKTEADARRQWWEKQFTDALQKHDMPKDPQVFGQMAYNVKLFKRLGKPLDMDAVAMKTRDDFIRWQKAWLMNTPDEKISEYVPEDFVKKLRKGDLAKLRAKGLAPKPGPKPAAENQTPQRRKSDKMTMSEWLDKRNERMSR